MNIWKKNIHRLPGKFLFYWRRYGNVWWLLRRSFSAWLKLVFWIWLFDRTFENIPDLTNSLRRIFIFVAISGEESAGRRLVHVALSGDKWIAVDRLQWLTTTTCSSVAVTSRRARRKKNYVLIFQPPFLSCGKFRASHNFPREVTSHPTESNLLSSQVLHDALFIPTTHVRSRRMFVYNDYVESVESLYIRLQISNCTFLSQNVAYQYCRL